MNLKSLLRTTQSHAPWIRPLKFGAYNAATRTLGWHMEPEFGLLSRLHAPRLALDIGANWGQSIEALRRTVPSAQIISFEPNPALADRLERAYGQGKNSVQVHRFALSDTAGHFDLYIPRYHNFIYDGLASLDRSEAEGWFTADRFAGFEREKLVIEKVRVETRTLDSLGLTPDIVKIDVQGAEERVVNGGAATFAASKPITIMECPAPSLVETMAALGLKAFYFDGQAFADWRMHTTNVIFLSDEHRAQLGI